jgi:hypothetical protein
VGSRRVGPVCGIAFVVAMVLALAVAGTQPNGKASVEHVTSYYAKHTSAQRASGVLLGFAALLFLVFAAELAVHFQRSSGGSSTAALLTLAGAVLIAAFLCLLAGLALTLAELSGHVSGETLQTLNVFANAPFVAVVTVGTSAFLLGAAAAALSTAALPRWLGWTALVLALVAAIPSHVLGGILDHIGFAAFTGLLLWMLVVSVLRLRADGRQPGQQPPR